MSKQIYIDSNGNEVQVSGTVNSADMLPIEAGSSKMTSEAIGDLSQLTTSDTSSLVGAVNEVVRGELRLATFSFSKSTPTNTEVAFSVYRADFNLPTGAKVKEAYLRLNHSSSVYAGFQYTFTISESGTQTLTGKVFNSSSSDKNFPIMAVCFYTLA